ncbi:hypothetical protein GJ496_011581 [Pomphorhynchus laevis]|nr:hypothetical protein GJ496_011581 [Pomphorhynchus laevis]
MRNLSPSAQNHKSSIPLQSYRQRTRRSPNKSPAHYRRRKRESSRSLSPRSSPIRRRTRKHSRSPRHRRRSPPRLRLDSRKASSTQIFTRSNPPPKIFDPSEFAGKTEEEIEMMKAMGFSQFSTTKNTHVAGACNASAANIQLKRRYRQYMNRRGGFNRPLDPIA